MFKIGDRVRYLPAEEGQVDLLGGCSISEDAEGIVTGEDYAFECPNRGRCYSVVFFAEYYGDHSKDSPDLFVFEDQLEGVFDDEFLTLTKKEAELVHLIIGSLSHTRGIDMFGLTVDDNLILDDLFDDLEELL